MSEQDDVDLEAKMEEFLRQQALRESGAPPLPPPYICHALCCHISAPICKQLDFGFMVCE